MYLYICSYCCDVLSILTKSTRVVVISVKRVAAFVLNAVEYAKNQDPYLLRTWQYSGSAGAPTMIALSPDARTVALSTSSTVHVYSVESDDCVASLRDVFASELTAFRVRLLVR